MPASSQYSVPASQREIPPVADPERIFSDGRYLVVPAMAQLGFESVREPDADESTASITQSMVYLSPWLKHVLMLFFPLYFVVRYFFGARCQVSFVGPCGWQRRRWLRCGLFLLLAVLGGISIWQGSQGYTLSEILLALLFPFFMPLAIWMVVLGWLALNVGLGYALESLSLLKPKGHQLGWFFLAGASPAFLEQQEQLESRLGAVVLPSQEPH